MSHLRKYYLNDDLAFIYNDLIHELGVASNSNIEVLYKGSDREYYASNKYWEYSPHASWTKIKIYVLDGVLWFAKRALFGNHLCEVTCCKLSRKADCKNHLVLESECLYLKDVSIKNITNFDLNCMSRPNHVFLEIQESFDTTSGRDLHKLKFKNFSTQAKPPRRATKGFVGHHLYSAEKVAIPPQTCKHAATGITLPPPPDVYPRAAPHSSMALKNTNVGAGVIDLH